MSTKGESHDLPIYSGGDLVGDVAQQGPITSPSATGTKLPWELRRLLEETLMFYGTHSDARMGPRTGGVVQGCPRGEPYIDSGERADEAQIEFQKWLAE